MFISYKYNFISLYLSPLSLFSILSVAYYSSRDNVIVFGTSNVKQLPALGRGNLWVDSFESDGRDIFVSFL